MARTPAPPAVAPSNSTDPDYVPRSHPSYSHSRRSSTASSATVTPASVLRAAAAAAAAASPASREPRVFLPEKVPPVSPLAADHTYPPHITSSTSYPNTASRGTTSGACVTPNRAPPTHRSPTTPSSTNSDPPPPPRAVIPTIPPYFTSSPSVPAAAANYINNDLFAKLKEAFLATDAGALLREALAHHDAHPAAAPAAVPDTPSAATDRAAAAAAATAGPPLAAPTLLQPRVAVILGVSTPWHKPLFAARLLSVCPALVWGFPTILHLLLWLVTLGAAGGGVRHVLAEYGPRDFAVTEAALATIWCFASGYLSFFFTDCLMSRWLINYTPQATIVRLLTVNAINAYVTTWTLFFIGGFEDNRLLLPGWIVIATTLTMCYHLTQRKINIRKETSTSINVFSIASFISMVCLLALLSSEPGYPTMQFVTMWRKRSDEIATFARRLSRKAYEALPESKR